MTKYNPFRPGSVISPGMFTGRADEIRSIEQSLFQTKNGNPHHFIIEGERGVGKSSLCLLRPALTSAGAELRLANGVTRRATSPREPPAILYS
jgi:hypothetical protein